MTNTAKELILKDVIKTAFNFDDKSFVDKPNNITWEDYYDELLDGEMEDSLYDAMNDFRNSGTETNIPVGSYSRHYECVQVARVIDDAAVSWTYWFGGGKYSEPEAIDWIDEAYLVKHEEQTITMTVFSKIE